MDIAVNVTVERHSQTIDQQRFDQRAALRRQNPDGLLAPHLIAGLIDVVPEQLRRIVVAPPDDSALCVAGVRLLRVKRAIENRNLPSAVRKVKRRSEPGEAGSDYKYILYPVWHPYFFLRASSSK